MAKQAAQEKKEVPALHPVFKIDNSTNAQLLSGVESRFSNITLNFQGKERAFIADETPADNLHPETVMIVYAAVLAMSSATSGSGDGAVVWLAENMNHPRVASVLQDGNEIAFEVKSSRTGIAGYRYPTSTIREVVEALTPVLESSIKEFGYPKAEPRGKKEKQEDFEVDWDVI